MHRLGRNLECHLGRFFEPSNGVLSCGRQWQRGQRQRQLRRVPCRRRHIRQNGRLRRAGFHIWNRRRAGFHIWNGLLCLGPCDPWQRLRLRLLGHQHDVARVKSWLQLHVRCVHVAGLAQKRRRGRHGLLRRARGAANGCEYLTLLCAQLVPLLAARTHRRQTHHRTARRRWRLIEVDHVHTSLSKHSAETGAAAALGGGARGGARGPATGLAEPQPTEGERGRVAAACLPFPFRNVLGVEVTLRGR